MGTGTDNKAETKTDEQQKPGEGADKEQEAAGKGLPKIFEWAYNNPGFTAGAIAGVHGLFTGGVGKAAQQGLLLMLAVGGLAPLIKKYTGLDNTIGNEQVASTEAKTQQTNQQPEQKEANKTANVEQLANENKEETKQLADAGVSAPDSDQELGSPAPAPQVIANQQGAAQQVQSV